MKDNKKDILRRAIIIFFVFGFIAILIGLIVLSKYKYGSAVICPFYDMFGWHCPGCGGTRMAVAILHGEFYQAFRYNMLVFISLPVLGIIFIVQSYLYIMYDRILEWLDKFLIVYALLLMIFSILRNTDTFAWLAPINVSK